MPRPLNTIVYIGRFQPFHNGHLALLQHALANAQRCIVVAGSAFHARTPFNPLTWQERREMILGSLPEIERRRVTVLPVRDYYDEPRWAAAVRAGVERLASGMDESIALIGHFKDESSAYLKAFPDWPLLRMQRQGNHDGSTLRHALYSADDAGAQLEQLADQLPAGSLIFLREWLRSAEFAAVRDEWSKIEADKAAWKDAPYPPILVTADALVSCAGQILLVRRGRAPGLGLYALPGGFIDQQETTLQSALRELREETALNIAAECVCDREVFDHPARSVRGRTITHAFHFALDDAPPLVQAGDDAAGVEWIDIAKLPELEGRFLDDHFMILDRFLGLVKDG